MAKKSVRGSRSFQTVRSYKRGKRRFGKRRTRVKAHTRFNRWWGPAEPIKERPILRIERRPTVNFKGKKIPPGFKIPDNVKKYIMKGMQSDGALLLAYYKEAEQIVAEGVRRGVESFKEKILRYVPQRTGALREDVLNSLEKSVKNLSLPIIVKIGAPKTKYASVINKMTPQHVQLKHSGGWGYSGVGNQPAISSNSKNPYRYNSIRGDPRAQYGFFSFVVLGAIDHIKREIRTVRELRNYPYNVFRWMIRIVEHRNNLNP